MWERLTAPEDGFSKLQRENLAIIESYGKALMEIVCRDVCDGHEISRVSLESLPSLCPEDKTSESSALRASDAGSGSAGPDPVHRPSEPVAGVRVQQRLPALIGGESEAG